MNCDMTVPGISILQSFVGGVPVKCPHCNCDMKHLGFDYYQCYLIQKGFKYQSKINLDDDWVDLSLFNPLCLVIQKLR